MEKIAIVGMSCRFPGANNLTEFWNNLINANDTISCFTNEQMRQVGISEDIFQQENYRPYRGILSNLTEVDSILEGFIKNDPYELGIIGRHSLCLTKEALELNNLSYDPKTSVHIGVASQPSYSFLKPDNLFDMNSSFVAKRYYSRSVAPAISYYYGFNGAAIDLYTACSSSIVAIDMACRELILRKSNLAIAGGFAIDYPQEFGYVYSPKGIFAIDGHCRTFDERASGTVFSNGAGIVVLKRLEDALKDDNEIFAIISGIAVNNDGKIKPGFLAPGINGQYECIKQAWQDANVEPNDFCYIETHGTSTQVGDPIEIYALNKLFKSSKSNSYKCAIGSVKSNIGHTTVASGMASLIKTVLVLKNKTLVPTLHFEKLNPHIDLSHSPLYIETKIKQIEASDKLTAGVSNFGLGGTNAHIVIGSY